VGKKSNENAAEGTGNIVNEGYKDYGRRNALL